MVIPRGLIWLGLAAAIGLAVWLGWPQAPTAVKDAPVVEAPVQPESPARTAVAPVPETVATLLRTSGMVWGETMPQGQTARAGQPGARLLPGEYALESGVVELVFDQGAAVIVEAPATFTLTGANELSLGSGKLVASVPPSAYGFTARAPGMDIVDLGTEFALKVRPGRDGNAADASTQVQVYHGPGPSAYADTLGQNDGSQSFFTAQRDILQVLGATFQANTTYTLTVAIGDRAPIPIYTTASTPEVNLGYGSTGGDNILLTLEANTQPVQVDGGWVDWSGTFTTGAAPAGEGQALRIELTNGTNVGWFDNVCLDASPVPEPGSLALLGLGGLTLLRRRRA